MKKIIIASTLAFALSHAYQAQASTASNQTIKGPAQLQTKELKESKTQNEMLGLGSGAVAGAMLGGPLGGVVGGILGFFMANDINQDNALTFQETSLAYMSGELSKQEQEFASLQQQYAQLEQSQMIHLASIDTKVATEWMSDLPTLESNVQFKTASFLVEDAFKAQLKSLAGLLNQYPNLSVHLSGFADARGDSQYNRILSEQRAQSVKDFLIQQRVSPQQIIAQGQGEIAYTAADELASDETKPAFVRAEALFFDRRVTLKLLNDQAAMTAANQ
ncbi:sortase-associated OmpA-like protein PdsO [Glaciecola sp. SC05]|uniref:sortase-associated OmpA-like protein PdsO n=1 Tax=Glaciecola sp. SC05 TaxID=1987355 RepID=UPI0035284080